MENIFVPLKNTYRNKDYFYINTKNIPFFSILTEKYTTKTFINHVIKNNVDDAMLFLCSSFKNKFDINILRQFFNDNNFYKFLCKVYFDKYQHDKINSFLIMDKNKRFKCIITFYMKDEPDKFSKWKIYKIVKEAIY